MRWVHEYINWVYEYINWGLIFISAHDTDYVSGALATLMRTAAPVDTSLSMEACTPTVAYFAR